MNEISKAMNDLFSIREGGVLKQDLPKCVRERIDWAANIEEDSGLSYIGALRAVLAEESDTEIREELSFDWLPVTKEFIDWRDTVAFSIKQMQIAAELIYGERRKRDDAD